MKIIRIIFHRTAPTNRDQFDYILHDLKLAIKICATMYNQARLCTLKKKRLKINNMYDDHEDIFINESSYLTLSYMQSAHFYATQSDILREINYVCGFSRRHSFKLSSI